MYLCNDYCKGKIKTKYIIGIVVSSTKKGFLIVEVLYECSLSAPVGAKSLGLLFLLVSA